MLDEQLPIWRSPHQQILGARTRTIVHADRLTRFRYNEVAEVIRNLLCVEPFVGRSKLVIDASGVGLGMHHFLDDARIPHVAVQMTAGSSMRQDENDRQLYNVSKNILLTELAAAWEHGTMRCADNLPMKDELLSELETFVVKHSATGGTETIAHGGEGNHGDLVVAAALSLFASNVGGSGFSEGKLKSYWG